MIVVGFLGGADDLAFEVARRAAAGTGARVEMVGAAAPGADGDRRLLELAGADIGHATVIRSGADRLDAKDLDLALRYLPDIRSVVLVRPPARLLATSIGSADWAGAPLVVVGPLEPEAIAVLDDSAKPGDERKAAAPASAAPILLEPPSADPDGTFSGFVAALAVRLDAGEQPEAAFRATVAALAVDPA